LGRAVEIMSATSALAESNERLWSRCGSLVEKYAEGIDEVAKDFRLKVGGLTNLELGKAEIEEIASVKSFKVGSEAELS